MNLKKSLHVVVHWNNCDLIQYRFNYDERHTEKEAFHMAVNWLKENEGFNEMEDAATVCELPRGPGINLD